MLKKMAFAIVATLAALSIPLAAPAWAHQDDDASLEASIDSHSILWLEASLEATDADVVGVKIFAGAKRGGGEVLQRCRFNYSGAGVYRCGIDVGEGSAARDYGSKLRALVSVDRHAVAQTAFALSQ